jgi:hypothetical protein
MYIIFLYALGRILQLVFWTYELIKMGSRILLISVLLMVKLCLVQPLALVKRIVSALLLPPAVPAASSSSPANSEGASKLVTKRVAIIGGGIAGHGCAFALGRTDGAFQVDLFEAREDFGGNAKIFEWPDKQKTGMNEVYMYILPWWSSLPCFHR